MNDKNDFKEIAFSGYYKDITFLKQSASGGAATVLSELVLDQNGVVFGVSYSLDFKSAQYIKINKKVDLRLLKSSKYIETNKFDIYEQVEKELKNGKKVLFIGLGCDIGAIKAYLKNHCINDNNLYTIDLICHGPTLSVVQKQFIDILEKKYQSKIVDFSVRYKKNGWIPPFLKAVFANGKIFMKPFYDTSFGYAFNVYAKKVCYACKFKGNNHLSDITIGDFWGISKKNISFNKEGVSVLIAHTNKGLNLISDINRNVFFICEADLEIAKKNNPMYSQSRKKHPKADLFEKLLFEVGLEKATRICNGNIKYFIKYKTNIFYFLLKIKKVLIK